MRLWVRRPWLSHLYIYISPNYYESVSYNEFYKPRFALEYFRRFFIDLKR